MNQYLQYAIGAYVLFSSTLLYKQYSKSNIEDTLAQTVAEQLSGKLSENASLIASAREDIKQVRSRMVTHEELQESTSALTRDLSEQTRSSIGQYMKQTNARIDMVTRAFKRVEINLSKGSSRVGKPSKKPSKPAPEEWGGLSAQELSWCKDVPGKCAPFVYSWESEHRVNGKPVARFASDNLWGDQTTLDLNLAFKVTALTYRADPNKPDDGLVRNQGIHLMAGYIDEKGDFVALAEDKILSTDPRFEGLSIYSPTQVYKANEIGLFDLSVLAGFGYVYQDGLALSAGTSLINLSKGRYRLGVRGIFTENRGLGAGAFASWHPAILGKEINLAPFVGYDYLFKDGFHAPSLGLYFKVW